MKRGELEFKISQLRQDKIIYANEAIATSLACIFILILASQFYYEDFWRNIVTYIVAAIAIGYTLFMGIGNFIRLLKIRKLEKMLEKIE